MDYAGWRRTIDFQAKERCGIELSSEFRERYVVKIEGREFIKYDGLVQLAGDRGWEDCRTETIQLPSEENGFYAVVRATVKTETGTYSGLGDASKDSVEPAMYPHLLRVAETRAKARALRDALRIGMVAVEELSSLEDVIGDGALLKPEMPKAEPKPEPRPKTREIDKDPGDVLFPIGRHKGKSIREVFQENRQYIEWFVNKFEAKHENEKIAQAAARKYLEDKKTA